MTHPQAGAPVAGEREAETHRRYVNNLVLRLDALLAELGQEEAEKLLSERLVKLRAAQPHRSEPDQGYDFASCVTCGQPVTVNSDGSVEPWSSIKYLLDSYPGSVRVKRPLCDEELLGSLCATFIKLRDAVPNASGDARDAEFADCPYAHGVKTRTEPCRHCGSGKCLRFNSVAARGES